MIFKSIFQRRKHNLESLQAAAAVLSTSPKGKDFLLSPLWLITRDGNNNGGNVTLVQDNASGLISYVLDQGLVFGLELFVQSQKAESGDGDFGDWCLSRGTSTYLISLTPSHVEIESPVW